MTADESEQEIYLSVGRCLSQWSRVEFGVSLLFLALNDRKLRPDDPLLASFEANRSFDAKRKTLNTFVMSDGKSSILFRERFKSLDNKLSNMALKRAEIAHFSIRIHFNEKNRAGVALLHPFGTFSGNFFERDKPPLTGKQVSERAELFRELADRVFRFVIYTTNMRGLLEAHDKPVENPEHLLDHPFTGEAPDVIIIG